MTFIEMKQKMLEHFAFMTEGTAQLYETDIDKDKLWELYLDSFPTDKNQIYKVNREHDCSCCRHFIKSIGGIVTIKNGKVISLWDFDIDDNTYAPSISAMKAYIHSRPIVNPFFTKQSRIGVEYNRTYENNVFNTFNHFHADIPRRFIASDMPAKQSAIRDTRNVFKRSLDEITDESLNIVLELIAQNSLYRGEEHKGVLEKFAGYKANYDPLTPEQKELFAWEQSAEAGIAVGRIRNHSIGTLLLDISNGVELDEAVRKYEAIVAPSNYKRPKAIFTKKMLDDAKQTISDMGYMNSLNRRYATLDDITVNNILFTNRDAARRISGGDVFDDMAASVCVNPKKFSKVEQITIENFITDILPTTKAIELLFENKLAANMVSLIAPQDKDSKTMFKWNNNYSWAYTGNVTDSMKERVKAHGGSVTGDLRFSIQWNENGLDDVDLDAHCNTPKNHIFFGNKLDRYSRGELDVDITHPSNQICGTDTTAVENITWADRRTMQDGVYKMFVNQYRGTLNYGFRAEIEFDSKVYSFDYPDRVRVNEEVEIANVRLKNGQFCIEPLLPETNRVSSREVWGLHTNQFIPVSIIMYSPNYWDEQNGIGNKHYFFMLKDCVNPETPNAFYNEFLCNELDQHKRVMEALGSRLAVAAADDQLSGVGFSSTQRNSIIVKVKGNSERILNITF